MDDPDQPTLASETYSDPLMTVKLCVYTAIAVIQISLWPASRMATHVVSARIEVACQGGLSFRDFVVLITLLNISLWKYHD